MHLTFLTGLKISLFSQILLQRSRVPTIYRLLPKGTISTWVKLLSQVRVSETETISMKEYKALQKKMKELEIENEILKKATAIFAKNQ